MSKNHPKGFIRPKQGVTPQMPRANKPPETKPSHEDDPLPEPDDVEGSIQQLGTISKIKRSIVNDTLALIQERTNNNAILLSEIAEQVTGTAFLRMLEADVGLTPAQYVRFLVANTKMRVDHGITRMAEQLAQSQGVIESLTQQAQSLAVKLQEARGEETTTVQSTPPDQETVDALDEDSDADTADAADNVTPFKESPYDGPAKDPDDYSTEDPQEASEKNPEVGPDEGMAEALKDLDEKTKPLQGADGPDGCCAEGKC